MSATGVENKIIVAVKSTDELKRLDAYLSQHPEVKMSRNQIQILIDDGRIFVNAEPASKKYLVQLNDNIEINIPLSKPSDIVPQEIPLDIRFEDEYLAVINKAAGMVVHPAAGNYSGTLVNALMHHFQNLSRRGGDERAGIVHRLDKNTSGLLIVAKDDRVHAALQEALQKREIKRNYSALVCGHVEKEGEIDAPIGRSLKERRKMAVTNRASREAQTMYARTERYRLYDLLEVSLRTGRTHQIRVHFAHIGHPVFGDPEYGGREKWHKGIFANEKMLAKKLLEIMPRQALHSRKLEFMHPIKGAKVVIESELPDDFKKLLQALDKEGR